MFFYFLSQSVANVKIIFVPFKFHFFDIMHMNIQAAKVFFWWKYHFFFAKRYNISKK